MIHYIWPIALVVLANVVYNISTKSTPAGANAFLSLAVTYLIAGICAILLYLLQGGHQKFTAELSKLNWTSIALGISVVALEFGYIHVYRAGWTVNTASLVANIALACVLVFVGFFLYKESPSAFLPAWKTACSSSVNCRSSPRYPLSEPPLSRLRP